MSDLLHKFVGHLTTSGVLKEDDSDKLVAIYSDINESDIMFEGANPDETQPD